MAQHPRRESGDSHSEMRKVRRSQRTPAVVGVVSDLYRIGLNPKGEPENFPQVWVNKISGQLFVVTPWWEIMSEDVMVEGTVGMVTNLPEEQRWKYGMLAQVGWLIQNESGVWFGVGTSVAEQMEKIGEL